MRRNLTVFFPVIAGLLFSIHSRAFQPIQKEGLYQVYLDLRKVENDRLPVEIITPIVNEDSVEFHMPRIIPGTYDVHNYGRFVTDLKAFDGHGRELEVNKLDQNRWLIRKATRLYRIAYQVEDTYDYEEETGIFKPAGTSIEDSVFLLNNFGFVGYLKGYKQADYELKVAKPTGFYGSTALVGEMTDTLDTYRIADYFTLHDNPLLYCMPDTAVEKVGGAEILVSVYSPGKTVSARACMERISAVLDAAARYLGGELPVEKYAVLIYCVAMDQAVSSYGALEHHTSTVLFMPEFDDDRFYSGVRDITAHEFFHIVTPLGIHSQMIADFDFINPEMSEHIWLYEGVTEYNSHLVQVRSGIYSIDEFLEVIRDKLYSSEDFDKDIPLTVASKFTLSFLKDQYYNFYQKGAIAGMALDLKLLELSNGEYRLVDLLRELGATYGADTFFVDAQLFDIITGATFPEMREFFARHFEGAEPFPLGELLEPAGILYKPEVQVEEVSIGEIELGYNFETGRLQIASIDETDPYTRKIGWQEGDEIVEFNGRKIDIGNLDEVITDFYKNSKEGDKFTAVVARPQGENEFKNKKLKVKLEKQLTVQEHYFRVLPDPSESQLELRKKWINQ